MSVHSGGSSSSSSSNVQYRYYRDRIFISEIPLSLICNVCNEKPITHELICKHNVCFWCVENQISNSKKGGCTYTCICGCVVSTNDILPLTGIKAMELENLNVLCLGNRSGCDNKDKLVEIEKHEVNCPFVECHCKFFQYGCFFKAPRKFLANHEEKCRKNPDVLLCKYTPLGCRVRATKNLIGNHINKCKYRFSEKFVYCPYKYLGCFIKIKKKYLSLHKQLCPFFLLKKKADKKKDSKDEKDKDKNLICEISLGFTRGFPDNKLFYSFMKNELSKFLPYVVEVKPARYSGELAVTMNNLSRSAIKGIILSTDCVSCANLSTLGCIRKGILFYEEAY